MWVSVFVPLQVDNKIRPCSLCAPEALFQGFRWFSLTYVEFILA